MDVIFSNKGGQYTNEEIIDAAVAHNVKAIELLVDRKKLLELEGLEGDKELRYFKTKLPESGLKLHGFCYYTDFNLLEDIMLAKKCVNLLNRLEGKVLRLIFKTIPGNMVMEKTYTTIETFLNSLARFASYSAGGGKGETVVRIAFDIFTQPNFGFNDFLKINRALQDSRNVGIAVDLGNFAKIDEIKKVIKQINGYEFTLNHVSVNDRLEEKLVKDFLLEVKYAYDGEIVVEPSKSKNKTMELVNMINKLEYNKNLMDYTKVSYQSSIARIFRKFGAASVEPCAGITAGERGTWKYVYRVGSQGIKKNGGIMVGFHHSTNWESFQVDNPKASGFVSVKTTGRANLKAKPIVLDASNFIYVSVVEGELKQDDEIIVVIGDRSQGSRGSRAQTFCQQGFTFFTLADADGFGSYFQDSAPPKINIKGGAAEKIKVITPSTVYKKEKFAINIRVEDSYGNVACGYQSKFKIYINGEEIKNIQFETVNGNNAIARISNVSLDKDGIYIVDVMDNNGIRGRSNSIRCISDKSEYKVYWGDIHCHLGYMDSVGTTDQFYDYARNISFLDFVCHSEHMDSYSGGRQASNSVQWEIIKDGAKKYYEPGKFVTLLGYENSETWDANVYFPGDEAPWHIDSFPKRLFDFARRNNALVIPHMTSYPQRQRGYDWTNYEEDVVPAIEIYSSHGSSEYFGGERPLINCEPGGYAIEALNMEHKLAFIGSSDGHDCMPGNSAWGRYANGLIAVYAKELTREAVFDAIKNRRCYAATNARILGYFYIDGHMPGSEYETLDNTNIKISVSFYGTNDIEKVDIVKNGVIFYSTGARGSNIQFEIEDTPKKKDNYYYARMKQADGEMAWISPIFVKVKSR